MRRIVPVLAVLLLGGAAHARGILIPVDKTVPPLAMLNHKVTISIDDQVAVTRVEQTFHNSTDRPQEATYVFPVPKGASVTKFTMWVDGKEQKGELVEADKAREIYNSIVRRTRDPGLLEYVGNDLLQVKVFPVPAKGDQKISLSYTSLAPREGDLVEYVYPLKTDGKSNATLEDFSIEATIKSQEAVQNVYSPTHAITLKRTSDGEVKVKFDREQGLLDKDFQMFVQTGTKDVGLTALTYRPVAGEPGYFLMLITPRVEAAQKLQVPRDVVLVLDTSGSMKGVKMEQARKALKYVLSNLNKDDRFALFNFANTVNRYKDGLLEPAADQLAQATKWVDNLDASGGTALEPALMEALALRPKDAEGRAFTVIFFTDGQPTLGEMKPEKILKKVADKNTANTRIFTFGVGDDVNATLLDGLAEQTRAVATYVRPAEDIEAKVSGLYTKISHPALTNLKLSATGDISLAEVYPVDLPDLFHGQQLVVLGRYTGKGTSAVRLTGNVGKEEKVFAYDFSFPERTGDDHAFVEQIWARRKVGFLLDQIRANGEQKELKDEVVRLAKRYGITTPYTSYLIVPDGPVPVVNQPPLPGPRPPVPLPMPIYAPAAAPPGLLGGKTDGTPQSVTDFARHVQAQPGEGAANRMKIEDQRYAAVPAPAPAGAPADPNATALQNAKEKKEAYDKAREALARKDTRAVQVEKLGVDLSVQTYNLRNQCRLENAAQQNVAGRNCLEVGGVWIDEGFDAKTPVVAVKAQSDAYFRILERHAAVKDVYRLGNHLVWLTPSGTALVIDANDGKEKLDDGEIDQLFVAKK
jgi:Ca-activated chloride channel family protein